MVSPQKGYSSLVKLQENIKKKPVKKIHIQHSSTADIKMLKSI